MPFKLSAKVKLNREKRLLKETLGDIVFRIENKKNGILSDAITHITI